MLLAKYKLTKNDVIYFEHNPEAASTAKDFGINTYFYDSKARDLSSLINFLSNNL